jgi:hypothetical protein
MSVLLSPSDVSVRIDDFTDYGKMTTVVPLHSVTQYRETFHELMLTMLERPDVMRTADRCYVHGSFAALSRRRNGYEALREAGIRALAEQICALDRTDAQAVCATALFSIPETQLFEEVCDASLSPQRLKELRRLYKEARTAQDLLLVRQIAEVGLEEVRPAADMAVVAAQQPPVPQMSNLYN